MLDFASRQPDRVVAMKLPDVFAAGGLAALEKRKICLFLFVLCCSNGRDQKVWIVWSSLCVVTVLLRDRHKNKTPRVQWTLCAEQCKKYREKKERKRWFDYCLICDWCFC